MHVQKIGDVEISKFSEIDSPWSSEPNWLFPTVERDFAEEQCSWLGPRLIEPTDLKLYLSFHSSRCQNAPSHHSCGHLQRKSQATSVDAGMEQPADAIHR